METMTVEQLYERHIKPLTMAEKLKLLALITQRLAEEASEEEVTEQDPTVATLREILGKGRRRRTRKRGGHPNRFFRPFILRALAQLNGRGRAKDVLELVYQMVKPHLSPVDEERLPLSGGYRWHRKANWERYYMVRERLLRDNSPQGIWELTEEGWREAKKLIAGETQEQ
jgi:hypothetical protein